MNHPDQIYEYHGRLVDWDTNGDLPIETQAEIVRRYNAYTGMLAALKQIENTHIADAQQIARAAIAKAEQE